MRYAVPPAILSVLSRLTKAPGNAAGVKTPSAPARRSLAQRPAKFQNPPLRRMPQDFERASNM